MNSNKNLFDIIIIGGGAAGMTAAIFASRNKKRVALIEKNDRVGKKLAITGKGRCNITNNCTIDEFFKNIPTNPRFLFSALNSFSPDDTMRFFNDLGVKLKTERGNRVFPVSDKASEIVDSLKKHCEEESVCFYYNKKVVKVNKDNDKICGIILDDNEILKSSCVILATGGASYCVTGSDGFGYKIAEQLGHTIIKPKAALVPIETNEKWINDLMGLSLKNVNLTIEDKNRKKIFSQMGEMLFTHFGISGPLVLSASSFIDENKEYNILIDFKPALDEKTLDLRLLREFSDNPNKSFSNILRSLLPAKAVPVFIKLSGINSETKSNQITKEMRQNLISIFKRFKLTFKKFRPLDEAIITKGGISVKEINPKTMESKKVKGVYFAGEIIDVDGFTGGFNLQIAFSTAFSAVKGICENEAAE